MKYDLKTQNYIPLAFLYLFTGCLVVVVEIDFEGMFDFLSQYGEQEFFVVLFAPICGVLSNTLPNNMKNQLVYWRYRNVLSGHRCKHLSKNDPRLNIRELELKWPDLFIHEMKPEDQNAFWYKEIYSPVKDKPEVLQAHRKYLLFRDATGGHFLILLGLLLWAFVGKFFPLELFSLWTYVVIVFIFILLSLAAKSSGDRMVVNAVVVAIGNS